MFRAISRSASALFLFSLGALAGCDRMVTPRPTQLTLDADAKAGKGNYLEAINLYEAALDGSERSAEVHYKLGLLYDDKMNDPLNALHHFKRVLTLAPTGKHAEEVKKFMKRDELTLLTSLAGDAIVTRADAANLRNENLKLRQQLDDRWAQKESSRRCRKGRRAQKRSLTTERKLSAAGALTPCSGATRWLRSRANFTKAPSRWGKILAANPDILAKPADLKPGQTLRIP